MAKPLPQPGIRNKARGRAHPCRIGSGKSPPHQPFPLLPLAMGTGQDSGLLGPQFPYLYPQSGDSGSGLDLLCRPAVEELGTWSKALDSLAWLPRAGEGAGGWRACCGPPATAARAFGPSLESETSHHSHPPLSSPASTFCSKPSWYRQPLPTTAQVHPPRSCQRPAWS